MPGKNLLGRCAALNLAALPDPPFTVISCTLTIQRSIEHTTAGSAPFCDLPPDEEDPDNNITTTESASASAVLELNAIPFSLAYVLDPSTMPPRTFMWFQDIDCCSGCFRPRIPFAPDLASEPFGYTIESAYTHGEESGQWYTNVTGARLVPTLRLAHLSGEGCADPNPCEDPYHLCWDDDASWFEFALTWDEVSLEGEPVSGLCYLCSEGDSGFSEEFYDLFGEPTSLDLVGTWELEGDAGCSDPPDADPTISLLITIS